LMVHSDGAVLAVGWILMVHVYFAHFSRHTIPFDASVITGKVPIERYREEFPLEYARIIAAEGHPLPSGGEVRVPPEREEPQTAEQRLEEDRQGPDGPGSR
jgi:hypothetical protein